VLKVYVILMLQCLFTALATAGVYFHEPTKKWMADHYYLHYVSMGLGIALMIVLMCFKKIARKVPVNYFLLLAFTLVWSYMVAGYTMKFPPEIVLCAASTTFVMTVGLTIVALFMKKDITKFGGALGAASLCLIPLILFSFFFPSRILYIVICVVVIVLSSIYIVYDTQRLTRGHLQFDEYIIGALSLYTDIINLFMALLGLGGQVA